MFCLADVEVEWQGVNGRKRERESEKTRKGKRCGQEEAKGKAKF